MPAAALTARHRGCLDLVLRHSGIFVGRQYATFAGITHGQKVHDFIGRVLAHGYARPIALGPNGRTRLFHVHYKSLYRAIGETEASFYDFDEFERLVKAAQSDPLALLLVLLGGEAGLRCGEMMALEWSDVDLAKRQMTRGAFRMEGPRHDAEGRAAAARAAHASGWARRCGARGICADRGCSANGAGVPLTQKVRAGAGAARPPGGRT